MQDAEIYVKTDAGREEIRSRTLGLPMSTRAILLMVDGQRTVAAMRAIIAGSKAPADVLDSLVAQGLIEPASAAAATAPAPIARSQQPAHEPVQQAQPAVTPPLARRVNPALPPSLHTPPASLKQKHTVSRITYDGPFDLALPTIFGPEHEPVTVFEPPSAAPAATPPAAPSVTTPVDRYEHLYGMINEVVRDFLPPHRRYFFQLKIERATTFEELLELLHDLQAPLAKSRGAAFASEVISRLRNAAV